MSHEKCSRMMYFYRFSYIQESLLGPFYENGHNYVNFKRIQAPPILAVSKRAFGFDLRESQNGVHYTREYQRLKTEILEKKENYK